MLILIDVALSVGIVSSEKSILSTILSALGCADSAKCTMSPNDDCQTTDPYGDIVCDPSTGRITGL
jgi:hypothetical protein